MNQHCWVTGTYTQIENGEPIVHGYYQWVPFMLLLQGKALEYVTRKALPMSFLSADKL